ncbi:MAG: bifunctional phosphopantothenoylcysteine decarboxylase/phosphopantothenate--cysteine ligase CoaBC, partial [Nitrososphaeraceae archaeon]|nr:bifunctional phosphopantothenoylcysteine decarboxylase/phosphopantothenate--cysteine ligase CoaBC [Nitrososphaeraceae archaeon]
IETTEEMLEVVVNELKSIKYDAAILSAAAADFGLMDRKMEKISSDQGEWIIKLKALPKIIGQVKKTDPKIFLVGFKAEYNITQEELIERSYKRLKEMDMDLIVANDVSKENVGFNVDTNEVFIIDNKKKITHVPLTQKREVASILIDKIASSLKP